MSTTEKDIALAKLDGVRATLDRRDEIVEELTRQARRDMLEAHEKHGLTYSQIAARVGRARSSVIEHLRKARKAREDAD
jgi:DNA-directed RNA polymerase specialized sigma24 family protein